MDNIAVSIRKLRKQYGSIEAIKEIDLTIGRGEVFGLLGPNGAGKTTTLECIEGMRRFDGGSIRVGGCDPEKDSEELRRRLGVQLQASALPEHMKVKEAIRLISGYGAGENCDISYDKFGIDAFREKQYGQLSVGQKRRLHLFLAMIHHPEILILDEPTAGLDVQSRAELHDEIRAIRQRGVTVLLATHDMAEAESLCDRIAIMIGGKIAACGTPEEITAAGNSETLIRLKTQRQTFRPDWKREDASFLGEKDGYLQWRSSDASACLIALLMQIRQAGDAIEDMRVERPSLEERFLELVKGA